MIATRYQIKSLLFGDYTWLDNKKDLQVNIEGMLVLFAFDVVQIFTSFVLDAAMIVWGWYSSIMVIGIVLYEVLVLDISFD
jgi:hypothetical protein